MSHWIYNDIRSLRLINNSHKLTTTRNIQNCWTFELGVSDHHLKDFLPLKSIVCESEP